METPPRNLEDLSARYAAGLRPEFLFFWGHTPKGDVLGNECLSQWFPAAFELEGKRFATAEHYMMWSKARLFEDDAAAARVLTAKSPAQAKAIGREVRGFGDDKWNAQRSLIVERGSFAKFSQNAALGAFLAATQQRVLVEASPRDRVWGIGLSASDERAQNPLSWRGSNLLGFALMHARAKLAAAEI